MKQTFHVNFSIADSEQTLEEFVEIGLSNKPETMVNGFVEDDSRVHFWQQNRKCTCGSHFFQITESVYKVMCSRCLTEYPVQ